MGCSGSCSHTVEAASDTSVFYVPKTFPTPPKSFEPDSSTHHLYVRQLNSYLINVAKSPHAFQVQVARRRQARFGEAWAEGNVPDMSAHPTTAGASMNVARADAGQCSVRPLQRT
ncbi:ACC2 [Symbiodinium natans]|uniref:ACC2 protein n=1 Tax=Symbiodinium natans TaxID=878477 RepID=A0A812MNN5_9DINO|nr:ACC2 [Symbiodinium natans]